MTIDALQIIAFMTLLARSLSRNNTKPLQLEVVECVVMGVRTFVCLAGVEMATPDANVVLIAGL